MLPKDLETEKLDELKAILVTLNDDAQESAVIILRALDFAQTALYSEERDNLRLMMLTPA